MTLTERSRNVDRLMAGLSPEALSRLQSQIISTGST
jgi:hypothetical protein